MDLDWLKDFLALAEHGNFSRAADLRNVTQPAFSRRIRALEDWVGTQLFTRSVQGAGLTPAGTSFLPRAADLLRQLEEARRETSAVGARRASSISTAATHVLSFTFFPGWIRQLVSLQDLGTLSLISDNLEACENLMLSGETQFLLCHWHAAAPIRLEAEKFESLRVGHDRLVAVSVADAAGNPRWSIPAKETSPTRLLAYAPSSGLGRILAADSSCAAAIARLDATFTSHHAATLANMVRNGDGAAWLPATLIEDDLATGRLVEAAGQGLLDIALDIKVFRSPDGRNAAADAMWRRLQGARRPL